MSKKNSVKPMFSLTSYLKNKAVRKAEKLQHRQEKRLAKAHNHAHQHDHELHENHVHEETEVLEVHDEVEVVTEE